MFWKSKRGRRARMKQPKKPTYEQKKLISKEGLNWKDWMIKDEDNISIALIHKETKEIKVIWK